MEAEDGVPTNACSGTGRGSGCAWSRIRVGEGRKLEPSWSRSWVDIEVAYQACRGVVSSGLILVTCISKKNEGCGQQGSRRQVGQKSLGAAPIT